MILKEVMNSPVLSIDSSEPVHKAAHIMSANNLGSLITTQSGRPIGIVTERDILKKIVATCRDVRTVKTSSIMTSPLKTADKSMDLENAALFMVKNEIKRLPVTEDGKIVGMVTFTDLLRFYPDIAKSSQIDTDKLSKKYRKWIKR